MSTVKALIYLYERDLDRLKAEIESFENEANLWCKEGAVTNTAGNLCLHLTGNLRHFVGLHVGNVPYERDREGEFSNTDIPRSELIAEIVATKQIVSDAISALTEEDLHEDFPIEFGKGRPTMSYMLIHLASHLGYHLGQINYHRRLLDK